MSDGDKLYEAQFPPMTLYLRAESQRQAVAQAKEIARRNGFQLHGERISVFLNRRASQVVATANIGSGLVGIYCHSM